MSKKLAEARDLIRRLVDAIDGNGAVGDYLQRLRDEADMWLATQATAGAGVPAKLVTHCPWCAAPVSVAHEPYCANDGCRWNNGGTAPPGVTPTDGSDRVAADHDLHSHMMIVATRVMEQRRQGEGGSLKALLRAVCRAIAADKNLRAKLAAGVLGTEGNKNG